MHYHTVEVLHDLRNAAQAALAARPSARRLSGPERAGIVTTRLASAFAKGRPALVCFITAGDGDTAANLDALDAGRGNLGA